MYRSLVGRLRRLEKVVGRYERAMAFVQVYIGEPLEEALSRQGIDGEAFRGLFIVEGRDDQPKAG